MDITPLIDKETKIITKYGDNKLTVNNVVYYHNIIILDNKLLEIKAHLPFQQILDLFLQYNQNTELLIIGSGEAANFLLKPIISSQLPNLNTEIMSLPSAIRTYNVLVTEGRKVSLIACWQNLTI